MVNHLPAHDFSWRQTVATIHCRIEYFEIAVDAMKRTYREIESCAQRIPQFAISFEPISLETITAAAPELFQNTSNQPQRTQRDTEELSSRHSSCSPVHRMIHAAVLAGTGPMSTVAATVAWAGVEAVAAAGGECMIENGGDTVLSSDREFFVAWNIPTAPRSLQGFAFRIASSDVILGICSSSGKSGHSVSMGNADLATVFSHDPALADACATALANRIKTVDDLETAFDFMDEIPEVVGAAAVIGEKVAFWRECPELVKMKK